MKIQFVCFLRAFFFLSVFFPFSQPRLTERKLQRQTLVFSAGANCLLRTVCFVCARLASSIMCSLCSFDSLPFHCDFAPLEHVRCVADGSFNHGLRAGLSPLDCYCSLKLRYFVLLVVTSGSIVNF